MPWLDILFYTNGIWQLMIMNLLHRLGRCWPLDRSVYTIARHCHRRQINTRHGQLPAGNWPWVKPLGGIATASRTGPIIATAKVLPGPFQPLVTGCIAIATHCHEHWSSWPNTHTHSDTSYWVITDHRYYHQMHKIWFFIDPIYIKSFFFILCSQLESMENNVQDQKNMNSNNPLKYFVYIIFVE